MAEYPDVTVRKITYAVQALNQQDLDRNFALATSNVLKWMQAARMGLQLTEDRKAKSMGGMADWEGSSRFTVTSPMIAKDMNTTERLVALHGPGSAKKYHNSLSRARSDMFRRTKHEMHPLMDDTQMSRTTASQAWAEADPEAKDHAGLRKEFGMDWSGSTQKQRIAHSHRVGVR